MRWSMITATTFIKSEPQGDYFGTSVLNLNKNCLAAMFKCYVSPINSRFSWGIYIKKKRSQTITIHRQTRGICQHQATIRLNKKYRLLICYDIKFCISYAPLFKIGVSFPSPIKGTLRYLTEAATRNQQANTSRQKSLPIFHPEKFCCVQYLKEI